MFVTNMEGRDEVDAQQETREDNYLIMKINSSFKVEIPFCWLCRKMKRGLYFFREKLNNLGKTKLSISRINALSINYL